MDHEKFIYYKTQIIGKDDISYSWYLIDKKRREGVHFHGGTMVNDPVGISNQYRFFAHGIECHKKTPHFEGHESIKGHCIVTGGDCFCDGSSLQASEQLGHINPDGSDDFLIWSVLHQYYGYWIEKEPETV